MARRERVVSGAQVEVKGAYRLLLVAFLSRSEGLLLWTTCSAADLPLGLLESEQPLFKKTSFQEYICVLTILLKMGEIIKNGGNWRIGWSGLSTTPPAYLATSLSKRS